MVSTTSVPDSATPVDPMHKWWVLGTVGTGVILATIDGSIVNVALPTMREDFDTGFNVIQWVAIGYLLTLAALTLGVGRIGDIVGKKKIYTAGFGFFTVASLLCGLAPTVGALIFFRVIQAVGAAMVLSLGPAILTEAFPAHERGKALGFIGTFVSIGIVTGPVVGGILIESFDWHAIFLVNLPVGIVGTWLAIRHVPDTPPMPGQKMDFVGAILLALSMLGLSLALTLGQDLGMTSPAVLGLLAGFVVFLVLFVQQERRHPSPMLRLALFRNTMLSVSVISGFLVFVAMSAAFLLLPFYLEGVLGFTPRQVGLLLGVAPLVLGVVAPAAGSWSDRIGIRRISLLGLVILVFTFVGFQFLSVDTTVLEFIALGIPLGAGIALFQSPNNSAIMGAVPREYMGVGGGILSLTRLLGQITGIAVLGSLWAALILAREPGTSDAAAASPATQVQSLRDVAIVMLVIIVGAAATAWFGLRREVVPSRA